MSKIHFDVDASEAKMLLNYYQKQYQSAWEEIPPNIKKRLQDISNLISTISMQLEAKENNLKSTLSNGTFRIKLGEIKVAGDSLPSKYDKEASRFVNSIYALNKRGHLLTTRQIIESWMEDDPKILEREGVSMGEMQGKLSSTLKQKVDNGMGVNRIGTTDEYYYGLLEWFDNKGHPKQEYQPEFLKPSLFTKV